MYALEICGLAKTFKGKKMRTVEALKGLNLCVEPGEVLGFLGPNGAGKSTTIKCLMGLLRPTRGSATIQGRDISSAEARRSVGYLPENPAFYDYLNAEEYLLFVGRAFGMAPELLAQRTEEMLKLLELWEHRKRLIRTYSKGMVQRVGLAQVLLHDPDIYILDEPMSGLDPIGRALVKEIILDLKKRGKCVFFSTHITDDVEKICDRVAVINKGQLLVVDSVQNILQQGTEGYTVTVVAGDGRREEVFVTTDRLQSFIRDAAGESRSIEKIEPRRKDMEAFFLEIVAR
ncbi:ABC transporter ATP-binding protein [Geomonas paludis]|uniref:ABC transporter ATP-binding protein n=1 Tax=Geomonas paludis TaxID=2740185 RepID=A0A6V8MW29_9BACT|nr:ABC transporter ATP-binding protein [Geomonas paludis]UPU34393.1 ABC transporter ATP-binding protein [Geomonas paludis]GFO64378.1 ABC transporter ATP-binding protein [Geomonas paludis]